MFDSLSDRLTGALKDLRGKGRLTDADIDAFGAAWPTILDNAGVAR